MKALDKPPLSILIVEDEEVALKLLVAILAKKFPGAALYPALNGKTGLDLFREHTPDIVITDINMPEMSGVQMAREIRSIKPKTKIIVLSAGAVDAVDVYPEQGAQAGPGIDHYILKPINFAALCAAIDECRAGL